MTYLRHPHLPDVRYPVPDGRVNDWLEAGWLADESSESTPNDPEPSGEGHPNEEETA